MNRDMDVKVEVLSMRSQVQCRISKINIEVCHGKVWGQHTEDMMEMHIEHNWSLSMPRKGHLSNPWEKEVIDLEWSRLIPSQGGWL